MISIVIKHVTPLKQSQFFPNDQVNIFCVSAASNYNRVSKRLIKSEIILICEWRRIQINKKIKKVVEERGGREM